MRSWTKKWTAHKDAQLLRFVAEKKPRPEIAKIMGTTELAIKQRAYELGAAANTRAKTEGEFNRIWIACAVKNGYPTAGIFN